MLNMVKLLLPITKHTDDFMKVMKKEFQDDDSKFIVRDPVEPSAEFYFIRMYSQYNRRETRFLLYRFYLEAHMNILFGALLDPNWGPLDVVILAGPSDDDDHGGYFA